MDTVLFRRPCDSGGEALSETVICGTIGRTGTPAYIYDSKKIIARCKLLREIPAAGVNVLYSIKANPHPGICRLVASAGLHFELASTGELAIAQQCNVAAGRCMVAGPAKRVNDLAQFITAGVGYINCESLAEAARIDHIAGQLRQRVKVNLRINPGEPVNGSKIKMGGRPSPFGIDEEDMEGAIRSLQQYPWIHFSGIHVYSGTQVLDLASLIRNFEYVRRLALSAAAITGSAPEVINFGGGFGIPFSESDMPLDEQQLVTSLASFFSAIRNDLGSADTEFYIETGRFLVGEAGYYVCTIVDIKVSRGKKFIILDGGINHFMALSPHFRFDARNPRIQLIRTGGMRHEDAGPTDLYDIAGPLCTSLDCLARRVALPQPAVGDRVVFPNAGAYALTMSPTGFLSHELPAEVLI